MRLRWRALAMVLAPFSFAPAAQAQVDPSPTTPQNPVIGSNNPLSSKLTLTIQNYYWPVVTAPRGSRAADAMFDRLSVQFSVGDIQNVAHIYVPSQGNATSDFGLGDVVAFDFIVNSIGRCNTALVHSWSCPRQ